MKREGKIFKPAQTKSREHQTTIAIPKPNPKTLKSQVTRWLGVAPEDTDAVEFASELAFAVLVEDVELGSFGRVVTWTDIDDLEDEDLETL